ncbi:hypothetical protein [Kitasatospora sp. NPDC057015]|uniref:hypothetical protein n=1 Tax=Kitasatospora sp. NPDC057015 TaxID=3346001 RepID=UPI003638E660
MTERIAQPSLPTGDQLRALRDFVHGRSYSAGSVAVRLPGEAPLAADSAVADAARVAGALYDVTDVLCERLFAELDAGQPGTGAEVAWEALLAITGVWRDAPEVPAELRELLADAARQRP